MTHLLDGKTAIVTGGSKGIGLAIAQRLCELGANVAICGRDTAGLEKAAEALQTVSGSKVIAQVCDVRNAQSVEDFVGAVKKAFGGKLEILVNNAGIYRTEPVEKHSLPVWEEVLQTNLTGCMLFCRAVLSTMIEQKTGRIINISSVSGRTGEIWASAYSASKFGMIGFTQSLALESAAHGITVNAVCPGWVATDMSIKQLEDPDWCKLNSLDSQDAKSNACFAIPQNRFIEPDEVAGLVAYLASDDARGITGQSINICGGLSLQ
jgi:NAD(P)-dependent dehydrogenase (short-subunit alcohol dehydrogenase family)